MSFTFFAESKKQTPDADDSKFKDGVNLIHALLTNKLLIGKLWKKTTPTMQELLIIINKDIPAFDKLEQIKLKVVGLIGKSANIFGKLVGDEKSGDTPYDLSNFKFDPENDIPKLKMTGLFEKFTDQRDILYYLIMRIVQPLAENAKSIIDSLSSDKTAYVVDSSTDQAKYYVDPQKFIENALRCVADLRFLITDKNEMSAIKESLIAEMKEIESRNKRRFEPR